MKIILLQNIYIQLNWLQIPIFVSMVLFCELFELNLTGFCSIVIFKSHVIVTIMNNQLCVHEYYNPFSHQVIKKLIVFLEMLTTKLPQLFMTSLLNHGLRSKMCSTQISVKITHPKVSINNLCQMKQEDIMGYLIIMLVKYWS